MMRRMIRTSAAAALATAAATAAGQGMFAVDAIVTRLHEQGHRMAPLKAQHPMLGVMTLGWQLEPQPDAVFEGRRHRAARMTVTMTGSNGAAERQQGSLYFATAPFRPVGGTNLQTGSHSVAERVSDLPDAARIGDGEVLNRVTHYTDAGKGSVIATGVSRWSLEPASGARAWLCLTTEEQHRGPPGQVVVKTCFEVDATGAVAAGRFDVVNGGMALAFR